MMSAKTASANSVKDQHDHAIELAAFEPSRQRRRPVRHLRQPHDIVDDQLADIERGDRQQRPRQPQQQGPEGERRADPPHHDNERPQRAQGDEPRLERVGAGGEQTPRPHRGPSRHSAASEVILDWKGQRDENVRPGRRRHPAYRETFGALIPKVVTIDAGGDHL